MNRGISEMSCLFTSTSVMKGVQASKASWAAGMSSFCSHSCLGRAESGVWRENITLIVWCERIVSKGPMCGNMINSKQKLERSLSKHASQLKLAHNSRVYLGRGAESPWHTVPAAHWKVECPSRSGKAFVRDSSRRHSWCRGWQLRVSYSTKSLLMRRTEQVRDASGLSHLSLYFDH